MITHQVTALLRRKHVPKLIQTRLVSYLQTHKKRFYKNANIQTVPDGYLIQLDNKTIKTPLLNKLYAPTQKLALAVAHEWHIQTAEIDLNAMPLTTICNTAIDNPTNISKDRLADELLNFLDTDTVCSLSEDPPALVDLENEKWTPIRDWFAGRFNVAVHSSMNLFDLNQCDETKEILKKYLLSMNWWQLNGLQTAVDSIQSFILPVAVLEKELSVTEAVTLSRLEVEYQITKWGNFEQVHDVDRCNQQTALTAGTLVYNLCTDLSDLQECAEATS